MKEINSKELREIQGCVKLVDVREGDEFLEMHLHNAISLPLSMIIQNDFEPELDCNGKIVFYCLDGYRSLDAITIFEKKGYKECYNLAGGLQSWLDAGYDVEN